MSNSLKYAAVIGKITENHTPEIVTGLGSWEELQGQHGDIFPMLEVANPPVEDEALTEKLLTAFRRTCELSFIRGFTALADLNAGGKGKRLTATDIPVDKINEFLANRRGDFATWVAAIVTQADLVQPDGTLKTQAEIGYILRTILPRTVVKFLPTKARPKKEKAEAKAQ